MSSLSYQGSKEPTGNVLELHYFDNDGPIFVCLPKVGLDHMCGRLLSDGEISLILLAAAEKELFHLIDRAVKRCGGFAVAFLESGVQFRKLNITMGDIQASGIKISTDVLVVAAQSGFADPHTGLISR